MRARYGRLFRRHFRRKKNALWLAGCIGVLLAVACIFSLELRLRPVVEVMAETKVSNTITQILDGAVAAEIASSATTYSDLITVEKDETGHIIALTSNMAALNDLRSRILSDVVSAVDAMDAQKLAIPVGNLTGINFFSGRGFALPIEVVMVGSAHAEYQSQFSDAGINQTRHQILLEVTVLVDILLPGGSLPSEICAQVPVAETVIVGNVPNTYVELPALQDSAGL